jgi:hypothetical protein
MPWFRRAAYSASGGRLSHWDVLQHFSLSQERGDDVDRQWEHYRRVIAAQPQSVSRQPTPNADENGERLAMRRPLIRNQPSTGRSQRARVAVSTAKDPR